MNAIEDNDYSSNWSKITSGIPMPEANLYTPQSQTFEGKGLFICFETDRLSGV